MVEKKQLCPFSKPLVGGWCQCSYARLADRCSGKMVCSREREFLSSCQIFVDVLRLQSRFVLSLSQADRELTHSQLMKIRCGGLLGMARELGYAIDDIPSVRTIHDQAVEQYGALEHFPFDKILKDIQSFSHRKQKNRPSRIE